MLLTAFHPARADNSPKQIQFGSENVQEAVTSRGFEPELPSGSVDYLPADCIHAGALANANEDPSKTVVCTIGLFGVRKIRQFRIFRRCSDDHCARVLVGADMDSIGAARVSKYLMSVRNHEATAIAIPTALHPRKS